MSEMIVILKWYWFVMVLHIHQIDSYESADKYWAWTNTKVHYNKEKISNKWAASWQNQQSGCAPSKDSDQPGHLPSLIRVFAVPAQSDQRNHGSLATYWAHREDSDQTGQMPWLIWVFAGRTLILLVCHAVAQITIVETAFWQYRIATTWF